MRWHFRALAAAEDSTWHVHFHVTPYVPGLRYLRLTNQTCSTSMKAALAGRLIGKEASHMKQIQRAKRHRRSVDGRQEPLATDPRDPDIVHAHRIARRSGRPGAGRVRSGSHNPAVPIPGR